MLRLNNIVKIFNKGTVDENVLFNDFSFNVNKGDFISVIGSPAERCSLTAVRSSLREMISQR